MAKLLTEKLPKSMTFHDFCIGDKSIISNNLYEINEESTQKERLKTKSIAKITTVASKSQQNNLLINSNKIWRSKDEMDLKPIENDETPKKFPQKVNRRGLPLNAPFSTWLQFFLLRKKGGRRIGAPQTTMRSSVSLCNQIF